MTTNKKHILALASWYPSRIFLDNGDFIQRHLQAISLLNNITLIHAVKDKNLQKDYEILDSTNKGIREIIIYFKPSVFRPFNLIKQIKAYLKGVSLVNNFDIIHLNVIYPAGLVALYLKSKYKKPILLTEHWSGLHENNFKKISAYKQFFIKNIFRKVDFISPVSMYLMNEINKIIKEKKYEIIPNVVNFNLFKISNNKNNEPKKFLHLSNLDDKVKNISAMLNTSKKLYNEGYKFEFHIGGNGNSTYISDFINKNNLQNCIKVFNRLKHQEVCKKMNSVDCFVLFSNYENQPCVQIEAFACGIPVIAKNVGGISEFFPDNFGFLVNNENELYDAMKKVINGKEFENSIKLNEFAINHFSSSIISKKYNDIYNKMLQ